MEEGLCSFANGFAGDGDLCKSDRQEGCTCASDEGECGGQTGGGYLPDADAVGCQGTEKESGRFAGGQRIGSSLPRSPDGRADKFEVNPETLNRRQRVVLDCPEFAFLIFKGPVAGLGFG